ncbi:MAG: Mut7-C RNAse domain-containing protein [Armatimonadota bacterium]
MRRLISSLKDAAEPFAGIKPARIKLYTMPRFIADCMLGKLAKWLRMLGYDTAYINDADDDELVRIAVREDRVLLTRDRRLCERRMVRKRCLFVDWGTTTQQIRQVLTALKLHINRDAIFTRCAVCNGEIVPVDKQSIADRVPPYVHKTQTEFGYCKHCDKIYWRGTHVKHVLEALDNARSDQK